MKFLVINFSVLQARHISEWYMHTSAFSKTPTTYLFSFSDELSDHVL